MTRTDAGRRRALALGGTLLLGAAAPRLSRAAPGYLQRSNPTAEGDYLDFSAGIDRPTVRPRLLNTGACVARLERLIDPAHVLEPVAEVAAINRAIAQASERPGGGIVRPQAAERLIIDEQAIRLLDRVAYDGGAIGTHDIRGGRFAAAVEAFEQRDIAILNVRTLGNGEGCYGVRLEDCENVLIHAVETREHDQNSIATGLRSRYVTVRYCRLSPGRDDRGNGTFRNQHGIVSSSFEGPDEPPPGARFGIVYSHDHAWYSNVIEHCDGHSMDAHCSNLECMGNWTDDARFGAKFPHSANVLIHHNRFGGARAEDPRDLPNFVLRFYSANDYAPGVGYATERVFVFRNRFEDNHGQSIRIDGIHGDLHLLGNHYATDDGTGIRLAAASKSSTDPGSFHGRVLACGADLQAPRHLSSSLDEKLVWQAETDPASCETEPAALISAMNAPKNEDWLANRRHPLPPLDVWGHDCDARR